MRRRTVLVTAASSLATVTLPTAATAKTTAAPRDIAYHRVDFASGTAAGTTLNGGALAIGAPIGTLAYTDPYGSGTAVEYEYASWMADSASPGFGFTQLVASWNAETPGGTWLEVAMRGTTGSGTTGWYVLGRWAADDTAFHRTSVGGQADSTGDVDVDTFVAASGVSLTSWQLRVTLYRPAGGTDTPTLRALGAMASALPAPSSKLTTSAAAGAEGITLDVPRYSQQIHNGQYPQWNGGGEAWCSPTSTSMVLGYWGSGPDAADYAWVDPGYADPWVDYAARETYDYRYTGCGNWPFNTAYAGRYGLDAFVTRLRSLAEAEAFIAAGIPVIASLSFKKGQIAGLDYSTAGHLLVIVGFTAAGDPVLNDPNSADDASVRKAVPRGDFEAAWLNSTGTAYIVHPTGTPLPTPPAQANW